ncbi:MAG: hypothetical protein AB7O45_14790 [Alphaproteobacteria bacterium]
MIRQTMLALAAAAILAAGCAENSPPAASTAAAPAVASAGGSRFDKAGFWTKEQDGRLWVFAAGSKELAEFQKHGEPAKQVTRIGAGPNGMTIKSSDAKVIDAYVAAK